MKTSLCLVLGLALGCGMSGCGKKEEGTATEKPSGQSSGNPLTAPVDYLGAVGAAQKQAERVVDLTTLQRAVQEFQAGEDRLPSSLQELVKEGYMPRLPAPPRGMAFGYDPRTGLVRLVQAAQPPPPGR